MSVFKFFQIAPNMMFLRGKKRLLESRRLISGTDNVLFTGIDGKLMRGR